MTDRTDLAFGYSDGDVDTNASTSPTLNALIDQRYSRRQALRSGASAATVAVFGGGLLAACDSANAGSDPYPNLASVGSSGSANSGQVVTLTSSATDNGPFTSAWVQTGGPAVTLIGANTPNASFIAPSVASTTALTFQYSATDSASQTAQGSTTVTIAPAALGFVAVAKNKNDVVTVPAGYTVSILYRKGDPLASGVAAYKNDGTDTGYSQRGGDHHDALHWYGLSAAGARSDASSTRGLLVMNHENIDPQYLHTNGSTTVGGARPESEALIEIESHGVAVVEVIEGASRAWTYVQNSSFNRRVTPNTPTQLNGPVRGSDLVKTAFSNDGTQGRGTINNCANGTTPWATNLTCEENWAGYFRRSGDNALRTAKELTALNRYGVTSSTGNYGWSTVVPADAASTLFRKWDARATAAGPLGDYRNEPNQYGWVVEIDPYDKSKAPRKRTALGRLGHEGAWPGKFTAGRKPAWYMGDDSRGEYMYKFVSATAWNAADGAESVTDRLAIGDKYLDAGTLYVARFDANGTGAWLPLVFGTGPLTASNATYPFADQADVLVNARLAADAVGATPMDRPEWTASNPVTGEIYLTLTNNSAALRPLNGTNAANPRHYNDPKGSTNQFGNPNGHIVRIREAGDNTESLTFTWDIWLFGAGSDLNPANINLSGLDATNDFSSPDGLWFARSTNPSGLVTPIAWLQTDDGAYTDVTNNQMLAAMPGIVGDGGARTITNTGSGGATATQATFVGKAPGTTLRRFLVGPVECEITGVDSTPDGRALFVNIQHPGEGGTSAAPSSHWPDSQATGTAGASVRPRSATIVITKNDGGVVGL